LSFFLKRFYFVGWRGSC